jgi:small subunit ribosomal protein S17
MNLKTFKGKIVSDKMQKTVVVAVEMPERHPIYEKVIKKTKRFKARDEVGVSIGDEVIIEECKPFSKEVSFRVVGKISEEEKK